MLGRNSLPVIVGLFTCITSVLAQPDFEALSIRPAAPGQSGETLGIPKGGPGTADAERYIHRGAALISVLRTAFNLENYQISGPDWVGIGKMPAADERYDIAGTLPPGTTQEQFRLMLQKMMKERFGMTFHFEKKDFPAYSLTIGKGPLQIKPSSERGSMRGTPVSGGMQWEGTTTLPEFASLLAFQLKAPVVDKTDLAGTYSVKTEFSTSLVASPDDARLPTIPSAIDDLGLKLTRTIRQIDVLVIDKINKVPTEN